MNCLLSRSTMISCSPFNGGTNCSYWCDRFNSCFKRNNFNGTESSEHLRTRQNFTTSGAWSIHIRPLLCNQNVTYWFKVQTSRNQGETNGIEGRKEKRCRILNFYRKLILTKCNAEKDAVSALESEIIFRAGGNNPIKEDVMFTTLVFEDFLYRLALSHFNATTTNFSFFRNNSAVDYLASRTFKHSGNQFRCADLGNENFMEIPSENVHENGSVVVAVMYKNLSEIFISDNNVNGAKKTRKLNTIIMSVEIYPEPDELEENITLVFKNIKKASGDIRECVFWDMFGDGPEGWSSQGCFTRILSESQTECKCNHLTHFAVLMDFTNDEEGYDKILTVLTHVGMALSLTGVSITIISYILLTDRHAPLSHIRVGLTSCIGAGHIVFLAGVDATGNKAVCVAVAALMQYCLMAAFCWMLVEGIYIYLFVVKVYNISDKIRLYHG
ncbi:adhesion G protein-coupled receptor L4-like, partial [Stylophora pistillata]|uniref:adhesion G protein-coupled receptor L4-like n=1 Tax=Stylophora pistillata TaxID=50429 RepID=UPI000C052746